MSSRGRARRSSTAAASPGIGGTSSCSRPGLSTSTPTCPRATPPSSSRSRTDLFSTRWGSTAKRRSRRTEVTRRCFTRTRHEPKDVRRRLAHDLRERRERRFGLSYQEICSVAKLTAPLHETLRHFALRPCVAPCSVGGGDVAVENRQDDAFDRGYAAVTRSWHGISLLTTSYLLQWLSSAYPTSVWRSL